MYNEQVEAWPFPWSQERLPRTFEPTTTEVTQQFHLSVINETSTTPVPMTTESSNFWNRLYNTLKDIFQSVFHMDVQSESVDVSHSISTNESVTRYEETTTGTEYPTEGTTVDHHFFQAFFASIANTFASIYDQFGPQWQNSSEVANISTFSPQKLFEDEVDILLQNHSLPFEDIILEDLKSSVVNALLSAWNDSLEMDEIMVVSPEEIQDKILEALQEIHHVLHVNKTEIATTTQRTPVVLDLDDFQAKFMAILKQAEAQSNEKSAKQPPSPKDSRNNVDWRDVLRIGNRGQ